MTCREAAEIGQSMGYPGYSAAAHSMASRPDYSGVTWVKDLADVFNPKPDVFSSKPPRMDAHKKRYSFRVRVTKERYEAVKRLLEVEGKFPTVNAWLDWWVWVWLKQKEAPAGGTAETSDD